MPVRPEWRHFYRGPEYRERRQRLLFRAANLCEDCGKPNRKMVWTVSGRVPIGEWPLMRPAMCWSRDGKRGWWNERGLAMTRSGVRFSLGFKTLRQVEVVLTMAHLNHNPTDNRDDNLRILCQWCHLHHDAPHHKETHSTRKDAARPLVQLEEFLRRGIKAQREVAEIIAQSVGPGAA